MHLFVCFPNEYSSELSILKKKKTDKKTKQKTQTNQNNKQKPTNQQKVCLLQFIRNTSFCFLVSLFLIYLVIVLEALEQRVLSKKMACFNLSESKFFPQVLASGLSFYVTQNKSINNMLSVLLIPLKN